MTLRFGLIGTNFISEWFVDACRASGVAEATAAYSRDVDRARDFGDRLGVPEAFGSLEAMLEADIDAVYVASPIMLHHEQSVKALDAGKHVLCEKTIGANAAQAADVFERARANGKVAMEAMRNLYDPAFDLVRQALPRIGTVRHVRFDKQQYSSRYDRFKSGEVMNAFDPTMGNSSISDIGVYAIEPLLDLFGTPQRVSGAGVRLANGFEGAGTLLAQYPDLVATCSWSKISTSHALNTIHGELGTITIDSISTPGHVSVEFATGDGEVLLDGIAPKDADNMHFEVRAFADLVARGHGDARREQVSVETRRIVDDYLAALG